MALFGFGKSSSSSKSESLGVGYGYSGSESGGVSGSEQRSGGVSADRVSSADLYRSLYERATGATARAAELTPTLSGQAATLFNSGAGFLSSLQEPSAVDARLADPGTADAQIASLGSDLEKFLTESVLPEIGSRGVNAGQLGGSRGEVAKGIAAEGLLREFTRGATDIRTADVARRDELARTSDEGATARTGLGLASLPGLFDLASEGATAGLSPYLALAQVLGPQTVLNDSSQFSTGDAFSRDYASSFGEDFSYNKATASSKSKSLSVNAGFGGAGPFGFGG